MQGSRFNSERTRGCLILEFKNVVGFHRKNMKQGKTKRRHPKQLRE